MMVEVRDMANLYELEMQSFPNGDECERYGIGIFRTYAEAEETAKRYLREVQGFRDYDCEYSIKETELIGDESVPLVHSWFGWNLDEDGNETDVLSGSVYSDAAAAEAAFEAVKAMNTREEWAMNCWQVGRCEWAEGFIRDYPSGKLAPTMAELRQELRARTDPRTMTSIEFEYDGNELHGFPVEVGEQLFLMAIEDDFIPNGFTIRRLRDIYEIRDRNGMYQKIAEREGLTGFDAPEVDISDWRSVFTSLHGLGKHIIVEREYEPEFFRIGVIERVEEDHIILRHYDADGVWLEPAKIEYREITSVTFEDRYVNVFSRYVV